MERRSDGPDDGRFDPVLEGLDPSDRFGTRAYLTAHPEAAASGLPALVHHLRSGA